MNPRLKKTMIVCLVALVLVGLFFLAIKGIAYVIAMVIVGAIGSVTGQTPSVAPAAPAPNVTPPTASPADAAFMPLVIVSGALLAMGLFLLKRYEHTNKTLKIAGFICALVGFTGIVLGPFILAIFF